MALATVYATVTGPVTDVYGGDTYSQPTAHGTHGKEVSDKDGSHRSNQRGERTRRNPDDASRQPDGTASRADGAGHGRARAARSTDGPGNVLGDPRGRLLAPRSRTGQEHARRHAPPHALAAGSGREPAVRGHDSRRPPATQLPALEHGRRRRGSRSRR